MTKKPAVLVGTTRLFVGLTLILTLIGLLFVFEASSAEALGMVGDPYFFLKQQAIRIALGLVLLVVTQYIPFSLWKKVAGALYIFSILLLIAVFIPGIGLNLNGASRWISLGGFAFQPVEVVKLSMVLFFASWLSEHQRLLPLLFLTALPALLLVLQPDLGSTLVVVAIAFGMYFVAGGKILKLIGLGSALTLLLIPVVIFSPYRMQRLTTFLDPNSDPQGSSFHVRQLIIALGNGGWLGQGIGNSKQKYFYIPEASSDSIFAIVAEETGFVGSTVIFGIFALYLLTATQLVAQQSLDRYAYLVGSGIVTWVALQWLINIAAVVALVPLTGIPLPFFSYGGSAQIMILTGSGIIARLRKEA